MEATETQVMAASSAPPDTTPPAFGEYWPGQGGVYGGILPAFDGLPARHLIFSGADAPEDLTWGPYGKAIEGAISRTDGRANTVALLAAKATQGLAFPAAEWAAQYSADGHTDFHLPSQAELFMASLYAPQVFDKRPWYWSSTQDSPYDAFAQDFEYGNSHWHGKDSGWRVRAVRWIPFNP